MNGVIIFADNRVLEKDSLENQLFEKLRSDDTLSVIPISRLIDLQAIVKTISTFKALILDWNFSDNETNDEDLQGVYKSVSTPEKLLDEADIYSLIYVYSQNLTFISEETEEKLNKRFGTKIHYKTKENIGNIDLEYESIKKDIENFEDKNKHMEIPFLWSQTINQSVQKIFFELEQADPNWIKEIRDTNKNSGEVIDVFHHILNESLIQNMSLRKALDKYTCNAQEKKEENTAKLYRRIYYSKISSDTPVMTGDIFQFNENEYGILITPECDINTKKDKDIYEFLITKKDFSTDFQNKHRKDREIFNNGIISRHVLVSFPFEEDKYNNVAVIDFGSAMQILKLKDKEGNFIKDKRISYKLNSPYIQQLRQRYVSFFGRYGVPAIPESLRDFNLK